MPLTWEIPPSAPDNHSHIPRVGVERVPARRVTYSSAAMAFACSTSGPGGGTKTVRR